MDIALWVLSFALIGIGLLGTVLPALPGPPLVLLGVLLAAWIDSFARIPGYICAVVSALALAAMAIDWIAGAMVVIFSINLYNFFLLFVFLGGSSVDLFIVFLFVKALNVVLLFQN